MGASRTACPGASSTGAEAKRVLEDLRYESQFWLRQYALTRAIVDQPPCVIGGINLDSGRLLSQPQLLFRANTGPSRIAAIPQRTGN
jgi:hypothetical protein